jgi:hypothetical protein
MNTHLVNSVTFSSWRPCTPPGVASPQAGPLLFPSVVRSHRSGREGRREKQKSGKLRNSLRRGHLTPRPPQKTRDLSANEYAPRELCYFFFVKALHASRGRIPTSGAPALPFRRASTRRLATFPRMNTRLVDSVTASLWRPCTTPGVASPQAGPLLFPSVVPPHS